MPELIDRQALLSDIDKDIEFFSSSAGNHDYFDYAKKNGLVIAKQIVGRQPTIELEVRHGRWIPTEYDSYADGAPVYDKWECSECGHEHNGEEDTLTAFCPDCGAYMREGGADNG